MVEVCFSHCKVFLPVKNFYHLSQFPQVNVHEAAALIDQRTVTIVHIVVASKLVQRSSSVASHVFWSLKHHASSWKKDLCFLGRKLKNVFLAANCCFETLLHALLGHRDATLPYKRIFSFFGLWNHSFPPSFFGKIVQTWIILCFSDLFIIECL